VIQELAERYLDKTIEAFDQNEDATPHIYFKDDTFHFSVEVDFMHGGKAVIFYPNELVHVVNSDTRDDAIAILTDKMTRYYERD